ncbi:ANTAR domain-containing protein [Microlunatus spumicola]
MDPDHVRSLAATMPLIEQAKGILMGCYGCDPTAAFAVLDRVSSARNLKLRDLAGLVVAAASTSVGAAPPDAPSPCDQVRRVLQEPPPAVEVSTPPRSGRGTGSGPTDRKGGR